MINVAATSTALTSGKLANFDWSPGSSTTATGDLFTINIGSSGTTTGNLFNITDAGSSLFSVSETLATTSIPASFTAPGDVSIAYDINFTNPTASYIKSAAPLYIQAGETFNSSDLTLKTYNQGTVVIDSSVSTGTGIQATINSLTSGTGLNISATALTSGTGINFTGPSSGITTGSGISISGTYTHTTTQNGNLANISLTDTSSNTSGSSEVRGLNVSSTINTTGSTGTKDIVPIHISAPTVTGCSGGDCRWNGVEVNTLTSGAASNITSSGILVNSTAIGSGSLNGIKIADLASAGSGTEYALSVGTGWDRGITVGDATDYVAINLNSGSNTGLLYAGSKRPTIKKIYSPEYDGAAITASGSATTNGSMTSDASPSANFRTYYEWSSTQSSLQDYQVIARITLPSNFSAWTTSNALQIDFNTNLTTNDTNKLDVTIYHPADDASKPVVQKTAQASGTAKTWTTLTIDDCELDDNAGVCTFGTSPDWDAAGETAVIYLKMYAKATGNYVQVGDITLNYLAAF